MSYKYNCLQQPYCQKNQQNCCPVVLAIAGQGIGGLGAAGARGPPGVGGILGYASYYFFSPQGPVAAGSPFSFPFESAVATGGISRVPATTDSFVLANAGTYEFSWQTSDTEGDVQTAIEIDGVVVPSTRVGKRTGTSQLSNTIILDVAAGSVVQLVVAPGSTNSLTSPIQGGTEPNTGNLVIKQIA